jgi:hypothetical protein
MMVGRLWMSRAGMSWPEDCGLGKEGNLVLGLGSDLKTLSWPDLDWQDRVQVGNAWGTSQKRRVLEIGLIFCRPWGRVVSDTFFSRDLPYFSRDFTCVQWNIPMCSPILIFIFGRRYKNVPTVFLKIGDSET